MSETPTPQLPETLSDPGTELAAQGGHQIPDLPPHTPRRTDIDPRAAKRAERQVALMFGASALMTVLFVIAFVQIPVDANVNIPFSTAQVNASNAALGLTFGLAIFLIGAGVIHWAKELMPDQEVVQLQAPAGEHARGARGGRRGLREGADASGFGQRKIIRRSLLLAMGLFPFRSSSCCATSTRVRSTSTSSPSRSGAKAHASSWTPPAAASSRRTSPRRHRLSDAGGPPLRCSTPRGTSTPAPRPRSFSCACRRRRFRANRATGGTTRSPGLLQDLHPRRLSDCALPATDTSSSMPLSPVDLRPQRLGNVVRPCCARLAAASDHDRRGRVLDRQERLPATGRPKLLGA